MFAKPYEASEKSSTFSERLQLKKIFMTDVKRIF